MSIITISNPKITLCISTLGAEMQSVKTESKERLWQGDPEVWSGRAPVLFPICGALKEGKFIYDGKEYSLPQHGFARRTEFEAEEVSQEKVVFLLRSSDETLKNYPFEFELRVIYTLSDTAVNIEYNVKNLTDGEMYFSIGSHEAYACPEGVENYRIVFEKNEDLIANGLSGRVLSLEKTRNFGENTNELKLCGQLFEDDSLNFFSLKSRSAVLENISNGERIRVDFPGADYFLVWQKPYAKYICLEPWCGIADIEGSSFDITQKLGIIKLDKNETFVKKHYITF